MGDHLMDGDDFDAFFTDEDSLRMQISAAQSTLRHARDYAVGILDRAKYHDDPVTPEHLEAILKDLKHAIKTLA